MHQLQDEVQYFNFTFVSGTLDQHDIFDLSNPLKTVKYFNLITTNCPDGYGGVFIAR